MLDGNAGKDDGILEWTRRRVPDDDETGPHPRRASILRWLVFGERDEPRPPGVGLYEPPDPDRDEIGICCSGGGIRSAAFNLGALQTMQAEPHRVLQQSKYLSAVSGGSYIAAAFCMVAKTRPADDAASDDSDPGLVDDARPPFHPGSPDEQYLRNHLGYLAPDGLARLHLVLRMAAGLFLNVLLIGLPVLIVGLVVGLVAQRYYGELRVLSLCSPTCSYTAHVPILVQVLVAAAAGLSAAFALLDVMWRPTRDRRRTFVETWEVRFFLLAVGLFLTLVVVPWLAARALGQKASPSFGDGAVQSVEAAVSSMAAILLAAIGHVRGRLRDERKAIAGVSRGLGKYGKVVRDAVIAIVVMLAVPVLLFALCVLGVLVGLIALEVGDPGVNVPGLGNVTYAFLAWLGGAAALLGALWWLADITAISLHPFYRRRLTSAFALKRVFVTRDGTVRPTTPADGTGDGAVEARQRSYDGLVKLSESGVEPGAGIKSWPMLIVCAAANISDPGATPPGRRVVSFTFSPNAIGGPLGAAKTADYESDLGRNRQRDVTLLAAVAMSGAALSPAMGKLTYRPLTFLLAIANIRLGVWVPNPRHVRARHGKAKLGSGRSSGLSPLTLRDDPEAATSLRHRPRPQYLWKEIAGRNRAGDKFVYVTDGGHYDNLGLVELLRRGCRTIYCFDAGGGTTSAALGDAIALARAELNVVIEMGPEAGDLAEDATSRRSARACVRGRILFPPDEDGRRVEGTLFYARSIVGDDAPWEVRNYQELDPVFPHHSTFEQFFDDQRFEAYRLLGQHVAARAIELGRLDRAPMPARNGASSEQARQQLLRDGPVDRRVAEGRDRVERALRVVGLRLVERGAQRAR